MSARSAKAATPAGRRRGAGPAPARSGSRPGKRAGAGAGPAARRAPASGAASAARRRPRSAPAPRSRAPRAAARRPPARALAVLGVALAMLAGYFLWFRDSSLVAITKVDVEGVTSADRDQIVRALSDAAKGMTTLHVDTARLASAAARFPTVAGISVDTSFPHGATIRVFERRPVAVAIAGGHEVPVAADGTLLPGLPRGQEPLPSLPLTEPPSGARLSGDALAEAHVAGAAPAPLLPHVDHLTTDRRYGIVATLRGGIQVRFGGADDARRKWAAAAAVLADPKLTSLTYLDVRVPSRPAAGGAPSGAVAAGA